MMLSFRRLGTCSRLLPNVRSNRFLTKISNSTASIPVSMDWWCHRPSAFYAYNRLAISSIGNGSDWQSFRNILSIQRFSSSQSLVDNSSTLSAKGAVGDSNDSILLDDVGAPENENAVLPPSSNLVHHSLLPRSSRRSFGSRHGRHGSNAVMNQFIQQLKPSDAFIPVNAIHAAQTIDLSILQSNAFEANALKKQMFGKSSIVIQLSDSIATDPATATPSSASPRYMAVFRFGSIVYFNVDPEEASKLTCSIKKMAASGKVAAGTERKENFGVLVARDIDTTTMLTNDQMFEPVTGDYCIVPELDMNGVAVIGTIMGQTVTLDSYSDSVEELLTNFARINSAVTRTGSFTPVDKSFLFKTVAQNNSIFIDMISKVRIKDRSDTAWNLTKYETIHYGLKEEFELDDRFENIEFKLNLIHNNAKFFLEVMHHQKANNLEWIIVVLILAECILMCIEMSGFGEVLFRSMVSVLPFLAPMQTVATSPIKTVPSLPSERKDDELSDKSL